MATHKTAKKSFFMNAYDIIMDNVRQIGLIIGLIIAVIGLSLGYMLWVNEKNKSAQRYFGFLAMEYNRAQQEKNFDWSPLLKKFEDGYEKHAGSSLVPYYKSYAVNILLQQNKKEEALNLLDTIIADVHTSALLPLYQMEKALVLLDSADSEKQKEAENLLTTLAHNNTNQFHDAALFYMGRYYWTQNNVDKARQLWKELIDEQADEKIASSPWAQQAQEYLSAIV